MIDFRYHLVSLISVFLALAVGIALGAGPLKEAIGDTLTGQVDQLRTEKDALRTELDATAVDLSQTEAALATVAPALLDGVLAQRRVAVIEVDEIVPEVRDQVTTRLSQAGASLTGTVVVTDQWTDPDQRTYRQSLAGTLVDYLDPKPAQDAGTGTELAEALTQALTTAVPANPDALSENAQIVLDLLTQAELISYEGDITAPADAIVILAGPTVTVQEMQQTEQALATASPQDVAARDQQRDAQLGAALQIATAAQARSNGAVVAGGELTDPSLVQRVRQDSGAATKISTVEAVNTLAGQVAVPMALSARINGIVGHYGPSPDTTAPMPPRVVLPPVERIPVPPDGGVVDPGAGADSGAGADAGADGAPGAEQG